MRRKGRRRKTTEMKRLRKLCILLAFVVMTFGCTQSSPPGFKPDSEPDGFAGIKWGAEFSEVKSAMVEMRSISDPAKPDEKVTIYYTKKGDNFRIGEARLDKIEYVFWKGRFAEVHITATGPENWDHLKKSLFEKYGSVDKPSQGADCWDGSLTRIALRYDKPSKTSLLTVASTKIASQELKEMFDKDKD